VQGQLAVGGLIKEFDLKTVFGQKPTRDIFASGADAEDQ